ncbi:MAG: hypothetical protein ABSF57_08710 [Acidobacteriaceae bacterium]|jgi:hypothetical protein
MQSSQFFGFHESSIVGVHQVGGTITLELDDVQLGEEMRAVVIRLIGVKSITRDGIEVADLVMEYEDGEILTLEHTETTSHLIVEWNDFKQHLSKTHSYRMIFDSIEIEIR